MGFVFWLFISNLIQIMLMPLLMIGQNIQGRASEARAEHDLEINIKAEAEIETILHHLERQNDMLVAMLGKAGRQARRGAQGRTGLSARRRSCGPAGAVAPAQSDFAHWMQAAPGRAQEVRAFEAYLHRAGVGGVLPLPQLLLNSSSWAACADAPYSLPPRALWPNIVPTLRFVRARIVPALGPVAALSRLSQFPRSTNAPAARPRAPMRSISRST